MAACAGKAQAATINFSAGQLRRPVGECLGNLHLHQICDCAAVRADEMHMGLGVGIKSLHTLDSGNHTCQALLTEQVQIPVYRTHGQIRDLLFQLRIDRFGTGVRLGSLQVMQDRIPLTKLLLRSLQLQSPLFDF